MGLLHDLAVKARVVAGWREHRLDLPRWLVRRPLLAFGIVSSEIAEAFSGRLDERLKLLAQCRVASIVGCDFCLDIQAALAQGSGLTDRQLLELAAFETSDAFTEDERLVLRFATVLSELPVGDTAALRESLVSRFGKAAVVELAAAIAHEHARTRLNLGLGVRPGRFAPDGACRIPLAHPGGAATRA
jgi:AhpD family alkylhydroperoxidase